MAELKVYGMNLFLAPSFETHRVIVAAPSRAAAARAFGVTSSRLAKLGSVTGNAAECELALRVPGQVYAQEDRHDAPFVAVLP